MSKSDLLPGRTLRHSGPPETIANYRGVQIDYNRLTAVLPRESVVLKLYEGIIHGEGPAWQGTRERLVWSDVPKHMFMNGNAVGADGTLVHCEHGRRCISRGGDYESQPQPIVF